MSKHGFSLSFYRFIQAVRNKRNSITRTIYIASNYTVLVTVKITNLSILISSTLLLEPSALGKPTQQSASLSHL